MLSQKARAIIFHILGVFLTLICCNPSAGARDYNDSIVLKGTERTYRVHLPPSLKRVDKPPLLIVLHGGGGSGKQMERMTLGKFNTLADREGFIVVYPDALGRHWNDGRGLRRYFSQREGVDDVGFIAALIDHFLRELNVDRKRIYVAGMSNGAMMCCRLASELSERVAAVAAVAGAMPSRVSWRGSWKGERKATTVAATEQRWSFT